MDQFQIKHLLNANGTYVCEATLKFIYNDNFSEILVRQGKYALSRHAGEAHSYMGDKYLHMYIISHEEALEIGSYYITPLNDVSKVVDEKELRGLEALFNRPPKVLAGPAQLMLPKYLDEVISGKLTAGPVYLDLENIPGISGKKRLKWINGFVSILDENNAPSGDYQYVSTEEKKEPESETIFSDNERESLISLTNQVREALLGKSTWDDIWTIINNPDVSIGTKQAMIMERYNAPTRK